MIHRRVSGLATALVTAATLALARPALAQIDSGRIDITVKDAAGTALPGVAIDLAGAAVRHAVSDLSGRAHLLDLPVGVYRVRMSLTRFAPYANSDVRVEAGASTALDVRLQAPGAPEQGELPPVVPTVDPRRDSIATTISRHELENVPNARDVWFALSTVPTVYEDRVDVGGTEPPRQATVSAKGAATTDNTWTLDGVPVTDAGDALLRPQDSTGASPFYYHVDALSELAVRTGGADPRSPTPGVQSNIVLRHGEDFAHGSAFLYYANDALQASNTASLVGPGGTSVPAGNGLSKLRDWGFDLGGPLLKDSIWIWGTVSSASTDLLALGSEPDNASLGTRAFKADGTWNENVRGSFTYYQNEKTEDGRDAGRLRPTETTWQQSGPSTLYKGEGQFVRGRFVAMVRGAHVGAGVQLVPTAGLKDYYIDDSGVAHNSFFEYQTTRPQRFYGGDGSYFLGSHELKFGGGWRSMDADTQQTFATSHLVASWAGYPNLLVKVARDYAAVTNARYLDGYASDTLSLDRLTLTGGVRVDRQTSSLGAASVAAVPGFATLLAAASATPADNVVAWTNVTPRLSAIYQLDAERKTTVRVTYAMLPSQLPGSIAAFVSPIQPAYAYYNGLDRNGDGAAQFTEVLTAQGLQGYSGFDPANPSRTTSINHVASGFKAPTTHEVTIGGDREIAPTFGVSATFTIRRMQDVLWTPLVGVTSANYIPAGTLNGTAPGVGAYSVPLYALGASAVPAGGGEMLANRPGYHQQYVGFEVSATKRLSTRWMARVAFSTNGWREYFDDPSVAIVDPTRAPAPYAASPVAGPNVNGGPVVTSTAATGATSFMSAPPLQFVANGMYTARWGINLAASVIARQGYAEPFFYSNVAAGDPLGRKTVLIVPRVDTFRLPAVATVDARAEKSFTFGVMKAAVDVDVFNLLNRATVLAQQEDARLVGSTGFGEPLQMLNPRVVRLGLRFMF